MNTDKIKMFITDKFEGVSWLIASVLLLSIIYSVSPHQIGLFAWTLSKITAGAYLGLLIDKTIFKLARPVDLTGDKDAMQKAYMRRAIIISATIIAATIGL